MFVLYVIHFSTKSIWLCLVPFYILNLACGNLYDNFYFIPTKLIFDRIGYELIFLVFVLKFCKLVETFKYSE